MPSFLEKYRFLVRCARWLRAPPGSRKQPNSDSIALSSLKLRAPRRPSRALRLRTSAVLQVSSRTLRLVVKRPASSKLVDKTGDGAAAPRYIRRVKTGSGDRFGHPAASAEMG